MTSSMDWLGAIGLALTFGGIIVAAVIAWRMKKPDADKNNAETIQILSQQVRDLVQQTTGLQKQIDELRAIPSRLYELTTRFRIAPEARVESQDLNIVKENSGQA